MTRNGKAEVLESVRTHRFFEGFDPAFLDALAAHAVERRFEANEVLAKEGTPANVLYAVLEGKVALEIGAADRTALTVQTVGPGELLGWSWLVPPHRWRFDARAVKPSRALEIDGTALRETLRERPEWGYEFLVRFMPVLAERLENTRIQLLDIHAR